jgi:hypothetical protein
MISSIGTIASSSFSNELLLVLSASTILEQTDSGFSKPSSEYLLKQNRLILDFKQNNIWNEFEYYYNFRSDGGNKFGFLNWKNPSLYTITGINSPSFIINSGYSGNGTSSYLDTGWIPSINNTITDLTAATMGTYVLTNISRANNVILGAKWDYIFWNARNPSNNATGGFHTLRAQSPNIVTSVTSSYGLNMFIRDGFFSEIGYVGPFSGSVSAQNQNVSARTLTTSATTFLGTIYSTQVGGQYGNQLLGCGFYGSRTLGNKQPEMKSLLDTFMSATTTTSIPTNTLNYLYVSPFIERYDGVLADIELVNPGSGYTTPFVSATTIVGGSGTNGKIILNVDTGTTKAIGTFIYNRGSDYSGTISVTFPTPPNGIAAQVNVYPNQKQAILGYPVYENQLLQLCKNNGINALIFYDLNFMDWPTNGLGTPSAPGKTMLKNFIEKARLSGITHISAARGWETNGNSETQINQIRDYHSWVTTSGFTNGYFDSITTEIEWWTTSDRTVFDSVVYGVNYAKLTLTSPSVQVNVYLGKGNYYYGTDPAMLSTKVDKWFVSTYMSTSRANTVGELYTDTRGDSLGLYRMKNIATAYTSTSKTKVLPIYSVESKLAQWNRNGGFNGVNYNSVDPDASEDFMGTYFTGNTVYDSWNSWVGSPYYPTNGSFYTETDTDIRNNINVEGAVLFFSKLFDISK